MEYLALYYTLINLSAYFFYGLDKYKAKKHKYRISENFLIVLSVLGGGLGSLLGMFSFHHKTKHRKFILLVPILTVLHIGLIHFLLK